MAWEMAGALASAAAWRMMVAAPWIARIAMTAATMRSGSPVPVPKTPSAAASTARFARTSFREQSRRSACSRRLRARRRGARGTGRWRSSAAMPTAPMVPQDGTVPCSACQITRADHPDAEQSHGRALDQRGAGPPAQREAEHREADRVVRGVGEEIERVRLQRGGARREAGGDLHQEHPGVDGEHGPEDGAVAADRRSAGGAGVVGAAGHGRGLAKRSRSPIRVYSCYRVKGQGMMASSLKIGDLARETDTRVVTIRYYEKIGLLPEPARSSTGNYRSYGRDTSSASGLSGGAARSASRSSRSAISGPCLGGGTPATPSTGSPRTTSRKWNARSPT